MFNYSSTTREEERVLKAKSIINGNEEQKYFGSRLATLYMASTHPT